jgi:hypothetical protein
MIRFDYSLLIKLNQGFLRLIKIIIIIIDFDFEYN